MYVRSCCFSSDSSLILYASMDITVRLWKWQTHDDSIVTFRAHGLGKYNLEMHVSRCEGELLCVFSFRRIHPFMFL